jgi:hypothetical protein
MSAYIPVELQRRIRDRYFNACAYCRTAEILTGMTNINLSILAGQMFQIKDEGRFTNEEQPKFITF